MSTAARPICCGTAMSIERVSVWDGGEVMHCYECGHWEPYETDEDGHYCGDPECERCGMWEPNGAARLDEYRP